MNKACLHNTLWVKLKVHFPNEFPAGYTSHNTHIDGVLGTKLRYNREGIH